MSDGLINPRKSVEEPIFIKPSRINRLDFSWNFVNRYVTYSDENFPRIRELIKIFNHEEGFLNTLASRLQYLNSSVEILKYFSSEYDWSQFEGIYDFYLRSFERIISQIAEAILYLLQFFERNKRSYSGPNIKKFEDIGKFLIDPNNCLPGYYPKSINNSVLLSILLFIRHSIVHDYRNIIYMPNAQNPIIKKDNIPLNNRYGTLRRQYLDYLFDTRVTKKLPQTFINIPAYKIHNNYLDINLWLTKKSTVDHDKTRISFSADTLGFLHRFTHVEFFILFRDIFEALLNENRK